MKSWINSDPVWAVRRMAALYLAMMVCRVAFYIHNSAIIGPIACDEVWHLFVGGLQFDTVSLLYVFLPWVVAALLPLRAREKRGYRAALWWYYIIVAAAVLLVNLGDAVYFHYASKRFTAEEFFYAGNENSLHMALKFAAENWYLVVIWIALVALLAAAYGRKRIPRTPLANPWAYYGVGTAVLLTAITLSIGGIRGGFTRTTRPLALGNATAWTPSPMKANLVLSNPFCVLRTIGGGKLSYTKYFPQQELDSIFTPYHYPPQGEMSRRNVMVIILESFSAEHSALLNPDLYPDGEGFTPFLDSLMRSGFTFTDAHANGRKSIEALPSVLSSIPSYKTPFVLMPQAIGPSCPLPALLAAEGYSTAFFCGSERGSMGFGAYARSAGISEQFGREDYQKAHGMGDHDGYWGIWDEPFLQFVGETLSERQQPLFATLFTLSSHHPFVVPAQYASALPQGKTKLHKCVAYTDMAVRRFFERFGQQEWFKNTIFVFCADHVSPETFAPKTLTPVGGTHIISFIYDHGRGAAMYPHASQQLDLMPTLLGMLGYGKPYFAFGRDVLREPQRPGVAVNYFNQRFQAITDSLAVYFDERQVTSAFERRDTLQKHPIGCTPGVAATERLLKAAIQQYYSHIEAKSFVVPADSTKTMR